MEWDKKTTFAVLFILFGSNFTGLLNGFSSDFRADGITMTEFLEEKASMIEYITIMDANDEDEMDILREKITRLDERSTECTRRIQNCEDDK